MQGCTQAFARLENAGLHRVPDGLRWDLGSRLLLEWWGGGDCVVLFMVPLRRMRREAGGGRGGSEGMQCGRGRECTHVARTDCTPYYASALTNQQLPSRKRQFRRANPARCSSFSARRFSNFRSQTSATTPRNGKRVYQNQRRKG